MRHYVTLGEKFTSFPDDIMSLV